MARKGENIYKRKDGRWEARFLKRTPDGKSRYGYVYAKTYREAKEKRRIAQAQWEENAAREKSSATLLSEVAARWENNRKGQVKESSFVKYHFTVANHILPALGHLCVEEMSHEIIENFALRLLRGEGHGAKPLAPRTVSDILAVLRSILRFAQRGGIPIGCDGSSVKIRRAPTQTRVLSRREQEILCRYLYNNMSPRNAGIFLSLFAGLRVGEVCALRWEDIHLEERTLRIRHTMQRIQSLDPLGPRTHVVITAPKSLTSARTIPLPENLIQILTELPGPRRGFFLTGEESRFTEPKVMQDHFDRILGRCGIGDANYHALRHTFATRCVELGFDIKSLSELLGHSTVAMTMDRYVHPTMEHKRERMQLLTLLLAGGERTANLTAKVG